MDAGSPHSKGSPPRRRTATCLPEFYRVTKPITTSREFSTEIITIYNRNEEIFLRSVRGDLGRDQEVWMVWRFPVTERLWSLRPGPVWWLFPAWGNDGNDPLPSPDNHPEPGTIKSCHHAPAYIGSMRFQSNYPELFRARKCFRKRVVHSQLSVDAPLTKVSRCQLKNPWPASGNTPMK